MSSDRHGIKLGKLTHYFDPKKAMNNNMMLLLNTEPVKVTMSAY